MLVLLDGLSRGRGIEVMSKATQSYAPLGIKLKSTFRRVNFSSDATIHPLFDEMIKAVGGQRPRGTDVVYLLTNKDLFVIESNGERNYCLAGFPRLRPPVDRL